MNSGAEKRAFTDWIRISDHSSPTVLLLPKALLERRFLELRDRARRLEELLPRRVSSEEQREVLCLLCKVHELEIENTEMQSNALLKDNVIRHKNFVVQRFEQHRHLCDEIIQQQRQFIVGESSRILLSSLQLQSTPFQILCLVYLHLQTLLYMTPYY